MLNKIVFRFKEAAVTFSRWKLGQPWVVKILHPGRPPVIISINYHKEPSFPSAFELYSDWISGHSESGLDRTVASTRSLPAAANLQKLVDSSANLRVDDV